MINKTAIINKDAKVHSSVKVGPYTVIGPNVEIGENTEIQSHVSITGNTKIGKKNKTFIIAEIGVNHDGNFLQAKKLIQEAKNIEGSGAFSIVLECITKKITTKITKSIKIPTIGIGSSNSCDGQILVTDDMLGLGCFIPKFIKQYINLNKIIDKNKN